MVALFVVLWWQGWSEILRAAGEDQPPNTEASHRSQNENTKTRHCSAKPFTRRKHEHDDDKAMAVSDRLF